MEQYVQEAFPEYTADVLAEQDKRVYTVRVVFGTKAAAINFNFDDHVGHFRMGIDRLMYKIQEELDEEDPQDAEAYGPYEVQGQHINT